MKIPLSNSTQVILVTYNPEIKLLKDNLSALANQFNNILVVDNGSANESEIRQIIKSFKQIIFLPLGENKGLATAQNNGLDVAIKNSSSWVLTMDQDSTIPPNLIREYQIIVDKEKNIGILGWAHVPSKAELTEEINIISSGSLIKVQALKECGGFDDGLFIDHIDNDIQLKIMLLGYRAVATNKVKLFHQIGSPTGKRTLTGKFFIGHSTVRLYYIVRNGIVLFKRYLIKLPRWAFKILLSSVLECIYSLMYYNNRLENIKIIIRAITDGIGSRLGKLDVNPHNGNKI